ncbi:11709_t:CDS:2 [Entrophospora sp. SA101]|nr:10237_t:CDS:2 [Entrophospora sp. SA101]CAJ0626554.1 149_t:CDS:2 [Entrophospora sp. SA101]CAJ0758154.1 8743_t:CDS:2 [Entrophospora sp. SA101]CAJ0765526.1 11709_t:CDS:2 [Entrophospora sp. SA101]CAJ0827151.1 16605_t:CDS:2 [Entrophospora sp. SA101]
MTIRLLKNLREKILINWRGRNVLFLKLIEKLKESPESDEVRILTRKTTNDERGEKINDGLEDYYDPEKGYDDYNSVGSGDEGDNNYKG